ncbi:MAG: hypothetical protein CUN55_15565, partial [Phototrophicales bacterium]
GPGVFINPRKLVEEISELKRQGIDVSPANYGIDARAHVTLDYHVRDDAFSFEVQKGKAGHESTGNGVKQTARDKVMRVGIRFGEWLQADCMFEIMHEKGLVSLLSGSTGTGESAEQTIRTLVHSYDSEREILKPFVVQDHDIYAKHGKDGRLSEGAQGALLDLDVGQYPGTTSSNPLLVPGYPDQRVGVIKLYTSSVGIAERPFVARMHPSLESSLVEAWGERGVTTGRDRKLGWLDLVALRYTIQAARVTHLVGSCGDRLDTLFSKNEKIGVVVGYNVDDKLYDQWDVSFHNRFVLRKAKPVIEWFEPWQQFHKDGILTDESQRFVDFVQDRIGMEFHAIGVGPGDQDELVLREFRD